MKLTINLENCYGIKSLEKTLDFSNKSAFSIYASNGTMKTSFAKTFMDLSKGTDTKDEIYSEKTTKREIKKDGVDLNGEDVFVIKPYDKEYRSDDISTLLVNQELKKEYDREYQDIKQAKDKFLGLIEESSGLTPKDIEIEVCKIFHQDEENKFLESLARIKDEVLDEEEGLYKGIKYNGLFNDKTQSVIGGQDFSDNIDSYVKTYNELLEKSNFFKKGIFNHTQASDIATHLEKNGFFKADHSVVLNTQEKQIKTKANLEEIINGEKNRILESEELKREFDKLDKILKKNQDIKKFREYLSDNPQIVSELSNLTSFKSKLWKGYFKEQKESFKDLVSKFNASKIRIKEIQEQAKKEQGKWHRVIDEFNNKFFVPFTLHVDNQMDVMLNNTLPAIKFKFNGIDIEETKLLDLLSQGERRALYILNILFEVEVRKNKTCLFVIDDIADSFDYKNKYAIIEYLKEISEVTNFYLIILTHNFDFHRSVYSRLYIKGETVLTAISNQGSIRLETEIYQNNPLNHWIDHLDNSAMLFASIPMVRNLFEYSRQEEKAEKLTNFLHIKDDTKNLTIKDLKTIYSEIFGDKVNKIKQLEDKFYDLLTSECEKIEDEQLENKIILSIAIRLKAEEYMILKIDNIESITSNQTFYFFEKYKEQYSNSSAIKTLLKVNLMTPENIHLNSFMYEPLMDMSSDELMQLYKQVKDLK